MKYYEVTITAFATVVVAADNEKQASEYAQWDLSTGDFQIEGTEVNSIDPECLESAKRHADRVIEAEE